MLRITIATALVAAALAGCQTTKQTGRDAPKVQRIDGKKIAGNPTLEAQFKQDGSVCLGEANKAALSAGVVYRGTGIVSNIAADQVIHRQQQSIDSVYMGCMAGRGYEKSDGPATIYVTQ